MSKSTNRSMGRVRAATEHGSRPYGARVRWEMSHEYRYDFAGDASLLIRGAFVVRLRPEMPSVSGYQRWMLEVEGFARASEAEAAGKTFAMASLWNAVSNRYSGRLSYRGALPFEVYDRTGEGGTGLRIREMQITAVPTPDSFVGELEESLPKVPVNDDRLLLTMELFTSAQLEATERTRFVTLVSSIEPLADAMLVSSAAQAALRACMKAVGKRKSLPLSERTRLRDRISGLKRESIGEALERVVAAALPIDPDAVGVVKQAYTLRSQLLHRGRTDRDYTSMMGAVEAVYREVIASRVGLTLAVSSGRRV